jgi:hypothetical protein
MWPAFENNFGLLHQCLGLLKSWRSSLSHSNHCSNIWEGETGERGSHQISQREAFLQQGSSRSQFGQGQEKKKHGMSLPRKLALSIAIKHFFLYFTKDLGAGRNHRFFPSAMNCRVCNRRHCRGCSSFHDFRSSTLIDQLSIFLSIL